MFNKTAEEFESAGCKYGDGGDGAVSTRSENSVSLAFEAHDYDSSNTIVLKSPLGDRDGRHC